MGDSGYYLRDRFLRIGGENNTFLSRLTSLKNMLADNVPEEIAFRYLGVTSEEEKKELKA